jgi:DMSO/TMAO reductase YedYZ molybdopterin-dependent catalytic subunit
VLGTVLLVFLAIVIATGFLSDEAYRPGLGDNQIVPVRLDIFPFAWPTGPTYLYAVTQGLHVTLGIVTVPVLLAKLWSVIPRLFTWPPVSSPAQALERLTLLGLVGGGLFQFATGILNVQLTYPFRFNFVVGHYYGAWVFTAALIAHVVVKWPAARRALKERGALKPLMDDLAATKPEPSGELVAATPDPPTISRRGFLGVVGLASGALAITWAGQSIGGPFRRLAVLAPRGGGSSFPVNKTAASARITPAMVGDAWRLTLTAGERTVELSRAELLALQQHTATLPIACVEGWTTTQEWTGVRLRDLARLAGVEGGDVLVESLQERGVLRRATLAANQVAASDSLLALKVNGDDLPLDHGYPARVIVPALPGVHCTKWVAAMTWSA